jgi:hypothetical protein
MKKAPLQFEVGKFYKRRDGQKCQVLAVDDPFDIQSSLPLVVRDQDGVRFLNVNGRVSNAVNYPTDIVAEWVEPYRMTVSVYLHRVRSGDKGIFPSFARLCSDADMVCHRRVELIEGEFDDLIQRPKEEE